MKAVILANGAMPHPQQTRALAAQAQLVVAADGGSRHARALGLTPHLVVGDLDSLDEAGRRAWLDAGVEMVQHPPQKDETDLELALLETAARGATELLVLAALGGRTDQMLANILLLALPELEGRRAALVEGPETLLLVRRGVRLWGQPGDGLSLIPLGGDAHGLLTRGLQYPLAGESLWLARARGISNVFTAAQAEVRVARGLLLAVLRAQGDVHAWPRWEPLTDES
ncbi:MAG: thiamine diphosphokinase [Chloroflexi bacterium]|nr:thiamine diphosphokinase [Chloroflexota bacterium]